MDNLVRQIADIYRDNLKPHTASGKLKNFTVTTEYNGNMFEVYFHLEDYWKYLEYGTKPHFPPIDAIKKWINVKRLVPKANKGKVPTVDQLAYAICKTISKKGTPATNVLSKSIDQSASLINKLTEELIKQLTNDIEV